MPDFVGATRMPIVGPTAPADRGIARKLPCVNNDAVDPRACRIYHVPGEHGDPRKVILRNPIFFARGQVSRCNRSEDQQ